MDEVAVCTKPAAVTTKVAPRREEQEQPQPDAEPALAKPLEVESDGEKIKCEDQSEDEDDESAETMAHIHAVIQLFREQEKERLRDLYSPDRAKAMSVIRRLREKEALLIRSTPFRKDGIVYFYLSICWC
ncbi:unnamed protein product [Urochloa humidicola]